MGDYLKYINEEHNGMVEIVYINKTDTDTIK